jgi:hypothetical protein
VTGLSTIGERWFSRKSHLPEAHKGFLVDDEQVQTKGRGVDVSSLPIPWGKVSEFVKRYITCEGRYQVVYFSDFILLSHLRHQKLINIPYYLLHSLHNMAHFVKKSKNPKNCISNHRLIGLLIRRGMGIPNDPLPEEEEQPNLVPVVMAEPEQLNPMPVVVIEPAVENPIPGPSHEPQPSAATTVEAPTVTASTSTSSPVEPEATQNPPVVETECPDFVDAQTLPDFDINDTNLSEPQIDLMETGIPDFTLGKEFQETILSIQAECK